MGGFSSFKSFGSQLAIPKFSLFDDGRITTTNSKIFPVPNNIFSSSTMTVSGATGALEYTNGTYNIFGSSFDGDGRHKIQQPFNGKDYWGGANNSYNNSTGNYLGSKSTIISGIEYFGEYVQFNTSFSISLISISQRMCANAVTYYIAGSNDGINWTHIINSNQTSGLLNINSSNYYTSYRIVFTNCISCNLNGVVYWGSLLSIIGNTLRY
jgi:hypothetical protein